MTKRDDYILTAESVTEGHPDKLCDTIADAVLDACLLGDPDSRVACEVLATAGKITVAGEITTKSMPDIPHIVCKTVRQIGYSGNYEVEVDVHDQSPDIADAVNGENEITAALSSLEADTKRQGSAHCFTVLEIASRLNRSGAALACAIAPTAPERSVPEAEDGATLALEAG